MAGEYLYGDSEPFPERYDFLAALKSFVACASECLVLQSEADMLERSLGEEAQASLQTHAAVEAYFAQLIDVASERAVRSPMPAAVGPYANKLVEHIEALGREAAQAKARELDAKTGRALAEVQQMRDEVKKVLSAWLISDPLPTHGWALSLELAGASPHGEVVVEHPGEITSSFLVDVGRDPNWARPRRVGELVSGLTVQVGVKKAFLRSSYQPDVATLDELFISAVDVGPDDAEIHLRRRMDQPRDSYVIVIDAADDGSTQVRITRLEETDDASPHLAEGEDKGRLEELASIVRRETRTVLGHKKRLLSLHIDGHDVFEQGLVSTLFSRVAARMRPLATEIERRSPNKNELSLKMEKPDGRREEIYLKKSELDRMVTHVPAELRSLFHGLAVFGADQTEPFPLTKAAKPEAEPEPAAAAPAPARPSSPPPARPSSPAPSLRATAVTMPRPSQMPPPKRKP